MTVSKKRVHESTRTQESHFWSLRFSFVPPLLTGLASIFSCHPPRSGEQSPVSSLQFGRFELFERSGGSALRAGPAQGSNGPLFPLLSYAQIVAVFTKEIRKIPL